TDTQIRETTREPVQAGDIILDEVEELPPEVRTRLRRNGVTSARDLERMKQRNVALPLVVGEDAALADVSPENDDRAASPARTPSPAGDTVSYKVLADVINRARRQRSAPMAHSLAVVRASNDSITFLLRGENLDDPSDTPGFPIAMLRGRDLPARRSGADIALEIPRALLIPGANVVALALDPVTVVDFDLAWGGQAQ
ncbi:MAG TPA: hypothetical protein VK913_03510, partial [Erythrobacter sp.]|nr:hypothetical protein [Erythrobacter sp.]